MSIIQEALKKAQNMPGIKERINKDPSSDSFVSARPKSALAPVSKLPVKSIFKPMPFYIAAAGVVALIGILAIALLFAGKNLLHKAPEIESPDAHQQVTYKPIAAASLQKETTEPKAQAVDTKPVDTVFEVKPQLPQLILNGIMYMEGSPRAIINGNVVVEGDSVSGAEVRKITRNNVVLKFKDTEIVIDLK